MEQTLSLLDVYNNAFGAERERLSTFLENDYLHFVDETQHRDAKKRFYRDMQTEFNSRYHLGLDGFVFGLVRFESYFDDEMKLFRKKPVEMNFNKAKEKFLASWPNDSRRTYIVDFVENPTELILQELGKLKAWRELGYNSFGYPDDFCRFDDDTPEEEIDLAKIVLEASQNNDKGNERSDKNLNNQSNENPSGKDNPQLKCIDEEDDRLQLLYKFMVAQRIMDEIPEEIFIAHFRGHTVEPKIKVIVPLKYLVWLLDSMNFMFPPNLYKYRVEDDWFSIISKVVIEHFSHYGKPISEAHIYNARFASKGVTSLKDKNYLVYEQIIKELKNTKN